MKKRFLLPLIAFCVIGMTGCDKTTNTSSEEVESIASSVVEGDSKDETSEVSSEVSSEVTSVVVEDSLTAKEVVDTLVAAGTGTNYTFKDYSDDTTIAYTKEAAYYSYFENGYITLPNSAGVKSVYNYTKGADEVIVVGDVAAESGTIAGDVDMMGYTIDVESGYAGEFAESNFVAADGKVTTDNANVIQVLQYAVAYSDSTFTSAKFVQNADDPDSLDITLVGADYNVDVNLGLIGTTELLGEASFIENYVAPTYSNYLADDQLASLDVLNLTYTTTGVNYLSAGETDADYAADSSFEAILENTVDAMAYTQYFNDELRTSLNYGKSEDGNVVSYVLNAQNEVVATDKGATWEEYGLTISALDGQLGESWACNDATNFKFIGSSDDAGKIAGLMTGYTIAVDSLVAVVEDGAISKFEITTAPALNYYGTNYAYAEFEVVPTEVGTTLIDAVAPYAESPVDGAELATALADLRLGNYTATRTNEGSDNVVSTLAVTSDATRYETFAPSEEDETVLVSGGVNGYYDSDEGLVGYSVASDGAINALANADAEADLTSVVASLNISDKVLTKDENGNFVVKSSIDGVVDELGFTDGDIEYADADSIVISLTEDKTAIDTIEYEYYDVNFETWAYEIKTATLTFSAVGTTTIALDFSAIVAYSIPTSFNEETENFFDGAEAIIGTEYENIPYLYSANGSWGLYIPADSSYVDYYNNELDADEVAAYRALLVTEGFVTANEGVTYIKGNLSLQLVEDYGGLDILATLVSAPVAA